MELVTEPDLTSPEQAQKFAQELQLILRYLRVSDADMEKGQMRVEANISLKSHPLPTSPSRREGEDIGGGGGIEGNSKLGVKVEIKNLNSFRVVKKAIEYEIERQTEVLERGEKVIQETRGWDEKKQITVSQRSKEQAHDYRYFPEPDLPRLSFDEKYIQDVKAELPELPQFRRARFKNEYELKDKDIETFVSNKDLGEYFEQVMSEFRAWIRVKEEKKKIKEEDYKKLAQIASNYILSDLLGLLGGMSVESEKFLISPENFAEFASILYKKEITSKIAKIVLKEMFEKGADPSTIIQEKGLAKIEDEGELDKIIQEIISKNLKAVKDFKNGKENALQFLLGQAMARSKGKASPEILRKLFTKALK